MTSINLVTYVRQRSNAVLRPYSLPNRALARIPTAEGMCYSMRCSIDISCAQLS